MKKKVWFIVLIGISLSISIWLLWPKGNKGRLAIDVSEVQNRLTIHHFDDAFFAADTQNFVAEISRLKVDYAPFFESAGDLKFWYDQRIDPAQKMLYNDVKKVLPNFDQLDGQLTNAFAHLYYYYPDLPDFQLYTYISKLDFEHPVIAADRYIFVATDLYLGKTHPAYQFQSSYLNYEKQPEFIPSDVVEHIAYTLAKRDNNDLSLLNDMVWWGKVMYFTEAMQPEAPDSVIARYSSKHINFCNENHVQIWTYFVDNKLLFNTLGEAQRKFIEPAPYSKFGLPFDNETPGMIGRWIGWQIVRSYMNNNPEVTLPQLMADTDSRTLFKNSKYKP